MRGRGLGLLSLLSPCWRLRPWRRSVVTSQFETLACESVNEPAWINAFFRLVLATPILVPISIGFIWGCAARRDRAYLLWIVVLFGSVVPLVVLIVTNPFCPS